MKWWGWQVLLHCPSLRKQVTGHQQRCLRHPVGWHCWQGLPVLLRPTIGSSKEITSSERPYFSCHHTELVIEHSPVPYSKLRTCSKHWKASRRPTEQGREAIPTFWAMSKSPGWVQEAESVTERGKKYHKGPSQPDLEKKSSFLCPGQNLYSSAVEGNSLRNAFQGLLRKPC